eukprot:Hpha_TRINITY_DN13487_c0_g2::TRINITY_DN13487_c0_g2_i1::g.130799::m.130799
MGPRPRRTLNAFERMQNCFLHYLRPYYLLQYAGFLFWFYARDSLVAGTWGRRTMEEEQWLDDLTGADISGLSREVQIFICWGLICFVRMLKGGGGAGEMGDNMLYYGRACTVVAAFIADWYIPLYLTVWWIALFMFTSEPAYEVPNKKFTKLDRVALNALFEPHPADSEKGQTYYFVNVWASWQKAGASKQFNTLFAELSAQYSNSFCKFAKVDAGRGAFQDFVRECKIDTSAMSKQIPSLILFKNGKEIRRLPVDNEGSYLSAYTREQIERHFDMRKIGEQTQKLSDEIRRRYTNKEPKKTR